MNSRREVLTGIFGALISIIIIAGSFAVAMTEVRSPVAQNLTSTLTPTSIPTHIILVTQRPGEPTYTPSPTFTLPPPSFTPTSAVASCQPPSGWSAITLQPGDTLESLARTYNTTPEALKQANCLVGNSLVPGTIFYVPGAPPPTEIPCGPPPGWVYYIVKEGDTLYSISRLYGVSVAQLQAANCMGSSTKIRVGQKLYVPNVTPNLPSPTPMPTQTSSPEPSATNTLLPSATSTPITPSPNPTQIPPTNPAPTDTPAPTNTPVPTDTPIVTDTSVPPTLTFTSTPEPTTQVPTEIPTSTIPPTITPHPTDTFTPVPTLSPTSTLTP